MTDKYPLINVDSFLDAASDAQVNANVIEARVSMLAFKNFDFIKKKVEFILEFSTYKRAFWASLAASCKDIYFIKQNATLVLVFPQRTDCGYIRTYRFRPSKDGVLPANLMATRVNLPDESSLYKILDAPSARFVFELWRTHLLRATNLPTEMVEGRMRNTSVDRAMIFMKGSGCVVCGATAHCYAATSLGHTESALMIQLPVCRQHLEEAKRHPSVFAFLASLFNLSLDFDSIEKLPYIQDDLIPIIHLTLAEELNGKVGKCEKRGRGWHMWIELESGWKWLLRLGSFTDFAYMLFEPGVKVERYRSDSAPDHPELKFFPIHEHSAPEVGAESIAPSFLYGHPLFDLKRLKSVSKKLGAV